MKNRNRDPRRKKIDSYMKDSIESFGGKSSYGRKSVRRRKADVNRTFRREVREILSGTGPDGSDEDDQVARISRKPWKKIPDSPLVESLDYSRLVASDPGLSSKFRNSSLRKIARNRLFKKRNVALWSKFYPN